MQATILLLFGTALLKLATSDALLLYVRPVARPWVGLAGLALVVLAGWTLLSLARNSTAPELADPTASVEISEDDSIDGHGHGAVTPAMWLVLAPVLAVLVIAPPALGASPRSGHRRCTPPWPGVSRRSRRAASRSGCRCFSS
ncbi:MAG: hypothetical protein ACJ74U_14975 [Jatrophihabitantaceae bacterium]